MRLFLQRISLVWCLMLVLPALAGAEEISFFLSFEDKTINPEIAHGVKVPVKPLSLEKNNFVEGFDGKVAFIRTKEEFPVYSMNKNLNLIEGTVSFWFKIKEGTEDRNVRFLHVFSPAENGEQLVIFYFLREKRFNRILAGIRMVSKKGEETVNLYIPSEVVNTGVWQKLDFTWHTEEAAIYLNGEKKDEQIMPDLYAGLAYFHPRDWGSISVLPVWTQDGDDWEPKTAIDNITIHTRALSEIEIKSNFQTQRLKAIGNH